MAGKGNKATERLSCVRNLHDRDEPLSKPFDNVIETHAMLDKIQNHNFSFGIKLPSVLRRETITTSR
jgi:hypothetical protein